MSATSLKTSGRVSQLTLYQLSNYSLRIFYIDFSGHAIVQLKCVIAHIGQVHIARCRAWKRCTSWPSYAVVLSCKKMSRNDNKCLNVSMRTRAALCACWFRCSIMHWKLIKREQITDSGIFKAILTVNFHKILCWTKIFQTIWTNHNMSILIEIVLHSRSKHIKKRTGTQPTIRMLGLHCCVYV